ncbi:MAG: YceI family protein [Acidimicrobiales bacterium]
MLPGLLTATRTGLAPAGDDELAIEGSATTSTSPPIYWTHNPGNSKLQLNIRAASIDTRNADRDAHLRSNDFFDMDTYPEITYASTAVELTGDGRYRVTGDLTIKGVTRPVIIDFEYTGNAVDPYGNQRIGLEGTTSVNRKDWGVNWNAALEAGGVLVSENVTLEFDVSAIRKADAG